MKKKLAAFVLSSSMVLSLAVPAFAAATSTDPATNPGKYLQDIKVVVGDQNGDLLEDSNWKRQDVTILLSKLLGKFEEAKGTADTHGFTDVRGDFYDGFISWAKANEYMVGESATAFGFDSEITVHQFAAVITRALGLNVAYADVPAAAVAAKILPEGTDFTAKATRGETYKIIVGALNTVIPGTNQTLGNKLGLPGFEVVIVDPVVTNAAPLNLKEIQVNFNTELDKTSAETVANYSVSGQTVSKAALSEDGKSVVLTLAGNFAQQASYEIIVEGVKDKLQKTAPKAVFTGVALDNTLPVAQSVAVVGPNALEVTFSEPISDTVGNAGTYKLNNGTYYVGVNGAVNGNKVTLNTSVLPEGTYTLNVAGAKDYAGFQSASTDLTFNYVKDVVAPVATVDSISQTKVVLKFNKAITNTGSLSVYHSYKGVGQYLGTSAWSDGNKTLTVTFATPVPTGNATIFIENASSGAAADAWGNAVVSTSLTAAVAADLTPPTVTGVNQHDARNIDITFSEEVTGANLPYNYTVKDANGTTISVTSATKQGTTNTYRLNLASALNGGSYTISIPKDVIADTSYNANKLAAYTATLSAVDKVAPTVDNAKFSADKKSIRVSFSEAMDAGVLNTSNYLIALNGSATALPSNTTVTWATDNKSVLIKFQTAQTDLTAGDKLYVSQVADLAGNKTVNFQTELTLTQDNVTDAEVATDSVKATSANTIEFTLNTPLSGLDVTKFTVNGAAAQSATYINSGGKAIVTVKSADSAKFGTDPQFVGVNAVTIAADGLTSAFDVKNTGTINVLASLVKDYAAPTISSIVTKDNDNNGKIDRIVVTFSEDLYIASVQESDFSVTGYNVKGLVVTGNVVTLTVEEQPFLDVDAKPSVALVGEVNDNSANRNKLASVAAAAATDGVGPVLAGINYTGTGTQVVVNFAGSVKASTIAAADFTLGGTGLAGKGITITGVTYSSGDTVTSATITLSADPALTAGQTLTVQLSGAGVISDAADNTNASVAAVSYTK